MNTCTFIVTASFGYTGYYEHNCYIDNKPVTIMPPSADEKRFLLAVSKDFELTVNQTKILKAIIDGKNTPRTIEEKTGVARPHVYTNLTHLLDKKLVEKESASVKKRNVPYRISISGFIQKVQERNMHFKDELDAGTKALDKLQELTREPDKPSFVAMSPEILGNTTEFHAKAAQLFVKSKNVFVSTRAPFLWMENYLGPDCNPYPGTKSFWDAQMEFLQKSVKDKSFKLKYLVDVDGYIAILNRRKTEDEKIKCIQAILKCIKGLDEGWNMEFLERPHKGPRPAQQAFAVSLDEGYFVMSVIDTDNVVEKGIFFQSPTIAELLMPKERQEATFLETREKLLKIAEEVVNKASFASKTRESLSNLLTTLANK